MPIDVAFRKVRLRCLIDKPKQFMWVGAYVKGCNSPMSLWSITFPNSQEKKGEKMIIDGCTCEYTPKILPCEPQLSLRCSCFLFVQCLPYWSDDVDNGGTNGIYCNWNYVKIWLIRHISWKTSKIKILKKYFFFLFFLLIFSP